MLTASRLHIGTRFVISGKSGVYKKISNDGDNIKATVVFGSSPDEVGRTDTIEGNLPCYIVPQEKDFAAKKKTQKPMPKKPRQNRFDEGMAISVAHPDKGVIYTDETPSAAKIAAFANAETIKIPSGEHEGVYTVTEVAVDVGASQIYIAVENQ